MSTSAESTRKRSIAPASKASGVEWLGEVPAHWEVKPLKFVAKTIMGQSPSSDAYTMDGNGTPFLQGNAEFGAKHPSPKHFCGVASKIAPIGSLLVSVRAPVGALNIADRKYGIGRGLCAVVADNTSLLPEFAWHALTVTRHELWSIATGSTYEAVSADEVAGMTLLVPPRDEQRAIARYLDRETARIDALIEKKQRQIELLHEKRAALISHAVTKGLNPDARMQDSGVDWLGTVPAHWTVSRVKYMATILRGKFTHRPRNDPRMYSGPYPFIQTGDVAAASKYVRDYDQTLNEDGLTVSKMFPKGTLVMTIAANIGDMAILRFEACFPDSIVGLVPKSDVDLDYLYYLFLAMRPALLGTATLNTQLNLNIDRIGAIEGIRPPAEEQRAIVRHLEEQVERASAVIERIRNSVVLLREYRTALISAAVTGKIDVRATASATGGSPA